MNKVLAVSLIALALAGCGIKVIPLTPDGKENTDEASGVRYYLPKPYLIVVQLPKDVENEQQGGGAGQRNSGNAHPRDSNLMESNAAGGKGQKPDDKKQEKPDDSGGASSSGNTSFQKEGKLYSVKLIYLPDYCHPMAIRQASPLWGSSQMKPTLQDGWMLTSLDAASDSKTAETITAMASLVSAVKGTGGGGGGGSKEQKLFNKGGEEVGGVLDTGLYEFYQHGDHLSLRLVTSFPVQEKDTEGREKVVIKDQCTPSTSVAPVVK